MPLVYHSCWSEKQNQKCFGGRETCVPTPHTECVPRIGICHSCPIDGPLEVAIAQAFVKITTSTKNPQPVSNASSGLSETREIKDPQARAQGDFPPNTENTAEVLREPAGTPHCSSGRLNLVSPLPLLMFRMKEAEVWNEIAEVRQNLSEKAWRGCWKYLCVPRASASAAATLWCWYQGWHRSCSPAHQRNKKNKNKTQS